MYLRTADTVFLRAFPGNEVEKLPGDGEVNV
jgi:hypothetical protein